MFYDMIKLGRLNYNIASGAPTRILQLQAQIKAKRVGVNNDKITVNKEFPRTETVENKLFPTAFDLYPMAAVTRS